MKTCTMWELSQLLYVNEMVLLGFCREVTKVGGGYVKEGN